MIVYYDPTSFAITGMSPFIDVNRQGPCFETDDPLALKIFLGQEKALKYVAIVRPGMNSKGVIKLKPLTNASSIPMTDIVYKIPKTDIFSELNILQNTSKKTISLMLLNDSLEWWKEDPTYKLHPIHLTACTNEDPYKPLWNRSIKASEFDLNSVFNYQGTDEFVLYTVRLFDSYNHEITSI
jgi:hypothetical protein